MTLVNDRLFDLLPAVYRERDAEQGWPLRDLLRVIAEQVDVVETDIDQLYNNWFIETCQDWVVPYIGDLVGYRPVYRASNVSTSPLPREQMRAELLMPRRDVANTIRDRRRKGTLSILEALAADAAGWSAFPVEFYRRLAVYQNINALHMSRGRTVDVRDGDALEDAGTAFDTLARTADVRRIASQRQKGWYNIPSVGIFVWRLGSYSVTKTPAYCQEEAGPWCYTFSVLGNDAPLFAKRGREPQPPRLARERSVPAPINRRELADHLGDYYGAGESFQLLRGATCDTVPASELVVADLSGWTYRTKSGTVAIDPALGRIAFPPAQLPKQGFWVSYHYGFPADMGGGEYDRAILQPAKCTLYVVGEGQRHRRIGDALEHWENDLIAAGPNPPPEILHAVIEIADSGVYVEPLWVTMGPGQSVQIRAANRKRPVIRLLDWHTDQPDSLSVTGDLGSALVLDGLLITGRGVVINGQTSCVTIRHCTLVPGWLLDAECCARRPNEPSLRIDQARPCVSIEHSIIGSIQIDASENQTDAVPLAISDSIVDATSDDRPAISGALGDMAYATASITRTTVIGQTLVHVLSLAEDSIFTGTMRVCRSQQGCVRFCYVRPGSRTPRRFHCQPDHAVAAAGPDLADMEQGRVRPQFTSTRYGTPAYCQLALSCAVEITAGAEDESEMGAFHDLYQPQRTANLQNRLDEYVPASMEAGIIFAD